MIQGPLRHLVLVFAIRKARPQDDTIVGPLDVASWTANVSPAPCTALSAPHSSLSARDPFFEHTRPDDVLVAEVDGVVVGAKLSKSIALVARSCADTHGLAVDPQRQRNGAGRRLVETAMQEAQDRGAHKLSLRVLEANTSARLLYVVRGFVDEGSAAPILYFIPQSKYALRGKVYGRSEMNGTRKTSEAGTAGEGGGLDPREAATLFEQTRLQARRQFEPAPPWLLVIRAVMVLATCGAVWLSVRGQHPYKGPTAAVIPVVFTFVAVNLGATLVVAKRATSGVSGRSRLRGAEIIVMAVAWVAVFVVMGLLAGAGVSRAIVYGLYPTTVPFMVVGLAWAGIMAARTNWRSCGTGLAVAVVGGVGAFAGPAGAWAVAGVGLFVVFVGNAAATAWRQRRTGPR